MVVWLHADNSPRWTRAFARVVRSFNPRSVRLRRELAVAALDTQSCPASTNACQPHTNISNLATNFSSLIIPPRPGRCKSIRSSSRNNFTLSLPLPHHWFWLLSKFLPTQRAKLVGKISSKTEGHSASDNLVDQMHQTTGTTPNDLNPNWQLRTPG